ncbi:hypothetical protein [Kitasatospora aureofaciens]|uniref:hypothetical protein n=1 Tax=Kitasatospora aureofaciens TaxID=1894 RepID=UPI0036F49F7E
MPTTTGFDPARLYAADSTTCSRREAEAGLDGDHHPAAQRAGRQRRGRDRVPSQSYPSFGRLDFSGVTVNGQVFDSYAPQAIDSGPYTETPLSNGSFAIVPA